MPRINPLPRTHKNPGETLAEVLFAVVILVFVMVSAMATLNRVISLNSNVTSRITGLNVAREGIEAVRNIRDTNWLKYSGDRRGKWKCRDVPHNDAGIRNSCDGTIDHEMDDFEYYTVDFLKDTGYQAYFLLPDTSFQLDLDLSNTNPNQEQYRLYRTPNGRFTHDDDSGTNTASIFYRQIQLEFPTNDTCNPNGCDEAKVRIISRVAWKRDGQLSDVVIEGYLYDYLDRDDY